MPTFGDTTAGFTKKWRLRKERKNSKLVTCHCPGLGSASPRLAEVNFPRGKTDQKHRPNLSSDTL